jgi:hypothetical protein
MIKMREEQEQKEGEGKIKGLRPLKYVGTNCRTRTMLGECHLSSASNKNGTVRRLYRTKDNAGPPHARRRRGVPQSGPILLLTWLIRSAFALSLLNGCQGIDYGRFVSRCATFDPAAASIRVVATSADLILGLHEEQQSSQ